LVFDDFDYRLGVPAGLVVHWLPGSAPAHRP